MKFQPMRLISATIGFASLALALGGCTSNTSLGTIFPVSTPPTAAIAAAAAPPNPDAYGKEKYPAGPLYNGADYLGDDPDPFIRSQIRRDMGMRYPGMN